MSTLEDKTNKALGLGLAGAAPMPDNAPEVCWADSRLARITVLRLLSERGFPAADVSCCHGILKDGTRCEVRLPFAQLPRRNMRKAIVQWAKAKGVYARGLGIFCAIDLHC